MKSARERLKWSCDKEGRKKNGKEKKWVCSRPSFPLYASFLHIHLRSILSPFLPSPVYFNGNLRDHVTVSMYFFPPCRTFRRVPDKRKNQRQITFSNTEQEKKLIRDKDGPSHYSFHELIRIESLLNKLTAAALDTSFLPLSFPSFFCSCSVHQNHAFFFFMHHHSKPSTIQTCNISPSFCFATPSATTNGLITTNTLHQLHSSGGSLLPFHAMHHANNVYCITHMFCRHSPVLPTVHCLLQKRGCRQGIQYIYSSILNLTEEQPAVVSQTRPSPYAHSVTPQVAHYPSIQLPLRTLLADGA